MDICAVPVSLRLPALALTESARFVFRRLVEAGPATRPSLGEALNFSKPTMSTAIAELEAHGLVASTGAASHGLGRKPLMYGVANRAGHAIGIDIGNTQVRAIAQNLAGTILIEVERPLSASGLRFDAEMAEAAGFVRHALEGAVGQDHGPLRAGAVALPAIVSATQPELAPWSNDLAALHAALAWDETARRLVENNVNCAALAELHHGAARHRTAFAYLQVGVNIGLGLVRDQKIHRGFNGAAGEVARLPFPWIEGGVPERHALERQLSSHALMARVGRTWQGEPPATAKALFELAAAGSQQARAAVEAHGRDIGQLAAAVVAIIDPGLVVLGGGVGQNALLLPPVRSTVEALTWPTEITTSGLGSRGTVLGALRLAFDATLDDLIGPPLPV